jgi:hypothetical protein
MTDGQLLDLVVTYCLTAGPPWCYQGWPRQLLHGYLSFHALHGTLRWTADARFDKEELVEAQVHGCGVAWQITETRIREAHRNGEHVFNWQPSDPKGDCIFMADFIASRPGSLRRMLRQFEEHHPWWRPLPVWSYREGNLVQVMRRPYQRRFAWPKPQEPYGKH